MGWNPINAVAKVGGGVTSLISGVPGNALELLKPVGRTAAQAGSDIWGGTKNIVFGPARILDRLGYSAFKGINFFTDIVQEAVGADDEWEGTLDVIYGSFSDNILGKNAYLNEEGKLEQGGLLVPGLLGTPDSAMGHAIHMLPGFVRQPFRGPLGATMEGVEWGYRKVMEEGLGTTLAVVQLAAKEGENPFDFEGGSGVGALFDAALEIDYNKLFDTRVWSQAYRMVNKEGGGGELDHWTWGQVNTFGIMGTDITDPTQVAIAEETAMFKTISGIYDLFGVFIADPFRAVGPTATVVRKYRGKSMPHLESNLGLTDPWAHLTESQRSTLKVGEFEYLDIDSGAPRSAAPTVADDLVNAAKPGGNVGLFGPRGLVSHEGHPINGRLSQTPKEFVETNKPYQDLMARIEKHASELDFTPAHGSGYAGIARNLDSPDAILVEELTGRILRDPLLRKTPGIGYGKDFTPELARAWALAPNTATRNLVTRLAMGDQAAREMVEGGVRRWVDEMQNTGLFDEMVKLDDDLASLKYERAKTVNDLAEESQKPYAGQGNVSRRQLDLEAKLAGLNEQIDVAESALNGAEQQANRRLTQMGRIDNDAPISVDGEVMPGYIFDVLLSMRHQQMRLLSRAIEGTAPVYGDMAALDNASLGLPGFENTAISAANDYVLAGLFTEGRGVNRALYASLSQPPQIPIRSKIGYNVMSVIEPVPLLGSTSRRIINVSRERAGQRFMHLDDVDQAYKQWEIILRDTSRIRVFDSDGIYVTNLLDEAVKKVRKDLKVDEAIPADTVNSLLGKWVGADIPTRRQMFFRYRDALTETLVEKIQQGLPGILDWRTNTTLRSSIAKEGLDPEGLLTHLKGSIRMQERALRQAKNEPTTRVYGLGTGTGNTDSALVLNIAGPDGSSRIVFEEIWPSQLPNTFVVPRYDQFQNLLEGPIRGRSAENLFERPSALGINDLRLMNNGFDWFMSQWKKSVLIRPAWPMRVTTDDSLRSAAEIGMAETIININNGIKTYFIDRTRRHGIDTMTPVMEEMRMRLTRYADPEDINAARGSVHRQLSDEIGEVETIRDEAGELQLQVDDAEAFDAALKSWEEANQEIPFDPLDVEVWDEGFLDILDIPGDTGFPGPGDAYIMVKGKATPVDEVTEVQLFQEWVELYGVESLQDLAQHQMAVGRELGGEKYGNLEKLRESAPGLSSPAKRHALGAATLGGLLFPAAPGAIAGSAAYSLYATRVAKNAAIREVGEHFVFQLRDVARLQLADDVATIREQVAAGSKTVDEGVREIEDIKYATDLLETQAKTIEEVMELLNPETSAAVRETLTLFDQVGMLMEDAGHQGYMMGGYGVSSVFGDSPFEVNINRQAISADAGRRRFIETAAKEAQRTIEDAAYGSEKLTWKTMSLLDEGTTSANFNRSWNTTFNRQFVPAEMTGSRTASEFSEFVVKIWEDTPTEEMIAWLESKRGTAFEAEFRNKFDSTQNLEIWVEVVKGEAENLLPNIPEFQALRARAAKGEELSWAKDVRPIILKFADRAQPGVSGRNLDEAVVLGVREIRSNSDGVNFGKIFARSDVTQDVAVAGLTKRVKQSIDNAMQALGTGVQDAVSRSPLWQSLTREEMARRVQAYRNSDGSYTLNHKQVQNLQEQSRRAALERTRNLLYDLAERGRLQEVVGHLAPFFGAWQEVAGRWAGIALRNPEFVSRAFHKLYLMQAKDEDGESRILIDWPQEWFSDLEEWGEKNALLGGPQLISVVGEAVDMTFNPTSISMFTAGLPLGPQVPAIVGELVVESPQLGEYLDLFVPYGTSEARSRIMRVLENFEPTVLKRLAALESGTPQGQKLDARIADNLITEWVRDGKREMYETGTAFIDAFNEEVVRRRRAISWIHAATGAISPVAIAPASPFKDITEEFNKKVVLYNNIYPEEGFDRAVVWLLETHPEMWGILARTSAVKTGLASGTLEGERNYQSHKDFADDHQNIGPWVMGIVGAPDVVETYNSFVRTAEIAQGRAYRPSPEEIAKQPEITMFFFGYRQLMKVVNEQLQSNLDPETGLPYSINHSSNKGVLAGKLNGFVDASGDKTPGLIQLKQDYPFGAEVYNSFNGSERGANIESFRIMLDEHLEDFAYRPEVKWINLHLGLRAELEAEMAARWAETGDPSFRNLNYSGRRDSRFPVGNTDLAQKWASWSIEAEKNQTFSETFLRYFEGDTIVYDTWLPEHKRIVNPDFEE